MSNIEDVNHNLSPVNYQNLLKAITETLQKNETCVKAQGTGISFDIDTVANQVAQRFATSNDIPFEDKKGTTYATTYVSKIEEKDAFSKRVQAIAKQMNDLLLKTVATANKKPVEYFNALLTPITSFAQTSTEGLSYPLHQAKKIEKQRLHLSTHTQHTDPWLKGHKLTLKVKEITTLDAQIISSICSYLEREQCTEDDIEDIRSALEEMSKKPSSDLSLLHDAIVEQSVARIHREAKVRYLRYLFEGMDEWKKSRTVQGTSPEEKVSLSEVGKGVLLLSNLIRRLQGLDAYIRQDKEKGHFQVTYQTTTTNYIDIFSREDAFDPLPIVPEVDGFLGESTDHIQGSKTFVSGLKLKLNGSVQVHGGAGRSVFEYNLGLLDAESDMYKARLTNAKTQERFYEQVLKVALLYCFVFVEMEDAKFRAGAYFENTLLPALKSGDKTQQIQALKALYRKLDTPEVRNNINVLRKVLSEFLLHKSIGPTKQEYPLVLSLDKRILLKDVEKMVVNHLFFQESFEQNGGKNVLKYVAIEDANASKERICSLPLTLTYEPIYYSATKDAPDLFSMRYETQDVQTLPIFLVPVDGDTQQFAKTYKNTKRLSLYYRHHKQVRPDSEQAFVYRFVYTLLSYTFVQVVTSYLSTIDARKLFLPIIRIHLEKQTPDEKNEKFDDESFMHTLSKVLEHMLAEDYTASSQGFYLDTVLNNDVYKRRNALNSLYTALPRLFQRQGSSVQPSQIAQCHLEKLAIIVVSSSKCDVNNKTPDVFRSVVLGEVIGVECLPDQTIRVGTISTFSTNQEKQHMYSRSDAVLEQVKQCYNQGYHHFLYVAHAPYSSTLHISDANEEADLFFMNKEIIQAMRHIGEDIKVYPVFCDKYYVVNHKKNSRMPEYKVDSLYIDDIGELSDLVNDQSRQSRIFFNLFSGATINQNTIYNGVMSYATLTNVYKGDVIYEQYTWNDLLNKKEPQSLGADILDYITLLHFARNEKSTDSRFKLDPFVNIIGDKSAGKVAVIPHMLSRVRFNMLAFLTDVRAVLRVSK